MGKRARGRCWALKRTMRKWIPESKMSVITQKEVLDGLTTRLGSSWGIEKTADSAEPRAHEAVKNF